MGPQNSVSVNASAHLRKGKAAVTPKHQYPSKKFIKVWQGLHDHLPIIPSTELKLYLNILFHVYAHDATNGQVQITNAQLRKETGLSADTIARALNWLSAPKSKDGRTFEPYIHVDGKGYEQIITVEKYVNPFPFGASRKEMAARAASLQSVDKSDEWNSEEADAVEWNEKVPF